MRIRLALATLLLLVIGGCGVHSTTVPPPTGNLDHTITMNWTQSFANNSPCSSTVTTSCFTGFNEGYTIGTTNTQIHTDTTAVCSGTTQPEACTSKFNSTLPLTSVVFYVTATYLDASGNAGVTGQAVSTAQTITADVPSSLTVTVQ